MGARTVIFEGGKKEYTGVNVIFGTVCNNLCHKCKENMEILIHQNEKFLPRTILKLDMLKKSYFENTVYAKTMFVYSPFCLENQKHQFLISLNTLNFWIQKIIIQEKKCFAIKKQGKIYFRKQKCGFSNVGQKESYKST